MEESTGPNGCNELPAHPSPHHTHGEDVFKPCRCLALPRAWAVNKSNLVLVSGSPEFSGETDVETHFLWVPTEGHKENSSTVAGGSAPVNGAEGLS